MPTTMLLPSVSLSQGETRNRAAAEIGSHTNNRLTRGLPL